MVEHVTEYPIFVLPSEDSTLDKIDKIYFSLVFFSYSTVLLFFTLSLIQNIAFRFFFPSSMEKSKAGKKKINHQ